MLTECKLSSPSISQVQWKLLNCGTKESKKSSGGLSLVVLFCFLVLNFHKSEESEIVSLFS